MKKFTLLFIVMLLTAFTYAQGPVLQSVEIGGKIPVSSDNYGKLFDTIYLNEFFIYYDFFCNYLAPDKGYIFGTQWDSLGNAGSYEQAQGFTDVPWIEEEVSGLLILVGLKATLGLGSKLQFRLYALDDSSSYTIDSNNYSIACPGTLLDTVSISWTDIDTSNVGLTTASFYWPNWPIPFYPNNIFCISYDVSDFYTHGDTISIIGVEPYGSEVYDPSTTWFREPVSNQWVQVSHYYTFGGTPLNAVISILPICRYYDVIGENSAYYNHMQLSQNVPNPSSGFTTIHYALDADAGVRFELYSISGQLVFSSNEGLKPAGTYTIDLNEYLLPGIYIYSLIANGKRLTKRMVVE
jgi:hypothetical protein